MTATGRGQFQARGAFFPKVGRYRILAQLRRGEQPPLGIGYFDYAIAPVGELTGPLNAFRGDDGTIQFGEKHYTANCASCHGTGGGGGGPSVASAAPPRDLVAEVLPGQH